MLSSPTAEGEICSHHDIVQRSEESKLHEWTEINRGDADAETVTASQGPVQPYIIECQVNTALLRFAHAARNSER